MYRRDSHEEGHGRFRPLFLRGLPGRAVLGRRNHGLFTEVLKAHVRDGRVDYASLRKDGRLDAYAARLSATDPASLASKNEKLAFWINVYNAFTLKLIAGRYPVKSISELHYGGSLALATALKKTAWDTYRFPVGGREYTLNEVEHKILRPVFNDFRIHGAIVCAAVSCPPLRSEAYEAAALEGQLDSQMRLFLSDASKNRYDERARVLYLSKIFSWFEKDFTGGGRTLVEAILPYMPFAMAAGVRSAGGGLTVKYLPYDWSLNGK